MATTLHSKSGALAVVLALICASFGANAQQPASVAAPTASTPMPRTDKPGAAATLGDDADYRIGSQDLLDIAVYGQSELTRTVRVNTRGKISLPLVGQVDAVGLTALQLENLLADRLSEAFLQSPQVTVFVKESISSRFTIEGAVAKPGVFPLQGQVTLLRAIALAGGQGALGDLSNVKLFRTLRSGEREALSFDVDKIRIGEAADPLIANDDLIVVGRSKARTALRDSLFGDIMGIFNPLGYMK